jgi:hypothetical protein
MQETDLARERDPENKLFWRMNCRRLDWESLRDSLLALSGQSDLTMGGPSVNLFQPPYSARRSIYGFIDRQNLPSLLRTFDFAPPDATSPQRHETTVAQQALYFMNSEFLRQQSQRLASRVEFAHCVSTHERIAVLYRLAFGRAPGPEEIEMGVKYLENSVGGELAAAEQSRFLTPWEEYVQAILLSNEFVFVD